MSLRKFHLREFRQAVCIVNNSEQMASFCRLPAAAEKCSQKRGRVLSIFFGLMCDFMNKIYAKAK